MLPFVLIACLVQPPVQDVEARVEGTLAQMTLEEKIAYIGGDRGFYVRPIPRLGLKEIKMSDGPVGVRNYGPTTAYPAGAALAATWNTDLARRYGLAIGRDARARGVHIVLGPGVNLARVPHNGRNFEYFGEDPFLAGRMATEYVRGMQSQGVAATVKHFVANDHENDRNRDSSEVSERALRELYLRPFEMAIRDGGCWAVMSSYNLINGTYASQNDFLLNQVLRNDWGFKGVCMTDWGGAHDAFGVAMYGTDLEMPSGAHMSASNLKPMIESGRLPVSVIDEKVRRILRLGYSMGFFDRNQTDGSIAKDDPSNAATALETARQGIVLLKNKGSILPLDPRRKQKLLLIGPNSNRPVTGGGGSSYTTPIRSISVADAIKEIVGPDVEVKVVGAPGDIAQAAFRIGDFFEDSDASKPGLKAEYFPNKELSGEPALVRFEDRIDGQWGRSSPAPEVRPDGFSARWTGFYKAKFSGPHYLVTRSDDGIRVWIDDEKKLDAWNDHGAEVHTQMVNLVAGTTYRVKVEYYENTGEAIAQFGIAPVQQVIDSALPEQETASADAVIGCFGFDAGSEGEGWDRPFELPHFQSVILAKAVALNPRTIVVLNSGAAVDLKPFGDKSAALLQAWYLGGEGNLALAEVLFGRTNPSGKLPSTFIRNWEDSFAFGTFPPKDNKVVYAEDVLMGYRYYDAKGIAPSYPFGFGLSYTTFRVGGLSVKQTGAPGSRKLVVSATVRNTGRRAGWETVQAYVGKVDPSVVRPIRELKGFQKVFLKPGEARLATIEVPVAELRFWSEAEKAWVLEPGAYHVWVGTSSRDLPAKATLRIDRA